MAEEISMDELLGGDTGNTGTIGTIDYGGNGVYDPDEFNNENRLPQEKNVVYPGGYTQEEYQEPLEFFDKFSKYITLAFIITFISIILLQKKVINLFFSKFINSDQRFGLIIFQSVLIGVISSFSSYYTLN